MSRLDALPADQKSVLQLLLRQGKGYDDLSGLLRLDADEVRSRAYDALDTLGPGAGGLPAERRHEIADWLLGQQDPDEAAATRAFVDGSTAGRAWAHGVARELEPLAGDRLPELPAEGAVDRRAGEPPPRAAAAASADEPATDDPPPAFAPRPTAGAARLAPRRRAAHRRRARRHRGRRRARPRPQRRRRQEGRQHRDPGRQHHLDRRPSRRSARRSTSRRPRTRPAKKALAIVQIVDVNGQQAINAVSQGLPTSNKKAAYGIWVLQQPVAGQAHRRLRQDRQQGPPRLPGRSCPRTSTSPATRRSWSPARRQRQPDAAGHDLPARVDPERRRRLGRAAAACRGS